MTDYALSRDGRPPPTQAEHKWWHFFESHLPNLSLALMIVTLVAAVLYPYVVITVPSGRVGVLWKRFDGGTVLDPLRLKDEGLHVILPWDRLFVYDLRLQAATETYHAISSDGVSMSISLNARFNVRHDSVPELHKNIGPTYRQLLVQPEIGSLIREIISQYLAEDVYSSKRQEVQDKIRALAVTKLGARIIISDTLILDIQLPQAIVTAINRKIEQYYVAEEYKFRIVREERESQRKAIEATGIRNFQQIVSQGISDSYLRWRGIEATLGLAQSNNSKIVIIGGGKDGLPIILGNVDSPAPRTTPNSDNPSQPTPTSPSDQPSTTPSDKPSNDAAPPPPAEKSPPANPAAERDKRPPASPAADPDKPPSTGPVADADKAPAAKPATSSKKTSTDRSTNATSKTQKKDDSNVLWSVSWSDIKSFFAQLMPSSASK